ncbi:valyl-tRNA synthetase [Coccomyxa subellipsoidea C-169]|uniref:valine--tRNA ligase n=1 Tax=Coccomyxa subellipsoidea (strain C-169) TaxID=574566 RepID=I0ZAG7_COCSC|nr:valyl-tRNA synthetase [Coccomyxa subellipsoidea C-169]EIE27636.1 valyl-tRNA synthetase [Coccomyxa subellipsoidea C-169]|eukprot:XP_005652180.1 valyl-tRNA synthetase [Coccomyxa subellipsoidea C-169]
MLHAGPSAPLADLPKTFDFVGEEQEIYDRHASTSIIVHMLSCSMPPPNVTGRLHMGHAMFVTLQDIMARFNRMRGRPTLWLPGTDHAGIATQMVVEKMLAAEGQSRLGLGRAAFEERVWAWKREYGDFITGQMRRLGASCDWSRERFTLDSQLSAAVREAFVRLHEKGLVYRGSYMVNWSPNLQTAVSDLEVDYTEDPGTLYFFRYPVAGGGGEHLPVATTRPETILGDTAVAVHPEDERYKHLVGRECEVPMSGGRRIPIIADTYVDREFGTGALKITPGHDPNDYEIGKEAGLVIKQEPYTMRVPRSQRGGEVVEPLVREQWFVRMQPLAEPALEAVANGTIRILPERFQKTYNMWLENIRDWCISRQLWWGHRIPVWYVFPDEASAEASLDGRSGDFVVARSDDEALVQARQQHGEGVALRQETDVLDTWFSSGLWPFSTLGWPDEAAPDLARFYPTTVMETGHDILFFWVARMIMMGIEFTGRAPFSTVFLHGLVRDGQGRKMSKSLGNVVDPVEVIGEYGTDALRFTLATGTTAGQDLNLSMDRVVGSRNLTNKLWNAGKFLQMALGQAGPAYAEAAAAADFSRPESLAELSLSERWILSSLHQVVDRVTAAHERLEFGETGRAFYDFFWSQYADWYIESAKTRLYGADADAAASTRAVLVYTFRTLLALAHPIMPFVTERLWQTLPLAQGAERQQLIGAPWPSHAGAIDETAITQYQARLAWLDPHKSLALQATVGAIRNARAEYNVELGRRIAARVTVASADLRAALDAELDVLCSLAKLDRAQACLRPRTFPPAPHFQIQIISCPHVMVSEPLAEAPSGSGTIVLVVGEGLEVLLPMAGLFDVTKEVARLNKQREKLEKDLAGVAGRMANRKFMDNAPPAVVADTLRQKEEAEQKVAAILEKVQQMSQLAA